MSQATPTPSDPRVNMAHERTGMARFRPQLALDRTTLAWVKTTLTMASFGIFRQVQPGAVLVVGRSGAHCRARCARKGRDKPCDTARREAHVAMDGCFAPAGSGAVGDLRAELRPGTPSSSAPTG
jgi:Domain of unknown function (DUF202)